MNTHMFVLSLLLALFAGLFTPVTPLPLGDLVVETRITPVYHLTSVAPKPQQFTNATFPGVAGSPSASSPNNKEIKVNPVPQAPPAPAPADDTGVSSPPAPAAPAPAPAAIYVAEYHPPSGPAPPGAPPASSAGDASSSSSSSSPAGSSDGSSSQKCRPDEPSIRVNNSSPHSICYMVEMSAAIGAGAPPSSITQDVACGPGSGFNVPAGGNIEFCPGAGFVGAVTAFRSSSASSGGPKRGSRVEFNFAAAAKETYYDVDYEMGMDSCTVGPRSGRPRMLDGGARQLGSLAGEKDCLGRVNEAFQRLDEGGKVALLQADAEGQWLRMDGEGNVGEVGMDKGAPPGLVRFLQLEVGLRGYVSSGSVGGQGVAGEEAELRRVADGFTWSVEERQMELTAY